MDSLRRRPADGSLQVGRVRDARATRADGGERTGELELVRCMTAQKSSASRIVRSRRKSENSNRSSSEGKDGMKGLAGSSASEEGGGALARV